MQVKILRSTIADGVHVEAGDTVDISDKDARLLLRMGKAEPVNPGEVAEPEGEPLATKGGK